VYSSLAGRYLGSWCSAFYVLENWRKRVDCLRENARLMEVSVGESDGGGFLVACCVGFGGLFLR